MNVTEAQRRLLELCAIRVEEASVDWSLIARQAQFDGGLEDLWRGVTSEKSAAAKRSAMVLRRGLRDPASLARKVETELEAAARAGARLITVLDQEYPANLRLIPNLPPFLFYRGDLLEADALSVAVVGTRTASDDGLRRAARIRRMHHRQPARRRRGLPPRRWPRFPRGSDHLGPSALDRPVTRWPA